MSKAALVHDIIDSQRLDASVLVETWLKADQPLAVTRASLAPTGYCVTHRFRPVGVHGGVAIIHSRDFQVAALQLDLVDRRVV